MKTIEWKCTCVIPQHHDCEECKKVINNLVKEKNNE